LIFNKLNLYQFKSLSNSEIEFAPITVLTGSNGVGKSSVIQSILLAKNTSENVNRLNRWEVELNGPYHLALGRAGHVQSLMHEDNLIKIFFNSERDHLNYTYLVNPIEHPYILQVEKSQSSGTLLKQDVNLHYLNAERLGPRKGLAFNPTGLITTGYQGEFVNYAINRSDEVHLTVHPSLNADSALPRFSTQVEAWMRMLIPDFRLKVTPLSEVDMVTISYSNSYLGDFISPTSTGFGITYALPVVTSGLIASSQLKSLLIVENPEAHLHPYSQSRMGQFLAMVSLSGVQVIIETHSEHVVNGIRLQLAKSESTEKGLVQYFSQDEGVTNIKKIEVKKNGELSEWPKGFFDQEEKDLYELLRLKRL